MTLLRTLMIKDKQYNKVLIEMSFDSTDHSMNKHEFIAKGRSMWVEGDFRSMNRHENSV